MAKKNVGQKQICVKQILGQKKKDGPKNVETKEFLSPKKVWSKNILVQYNQGSKKTFG